MKQLLTILLLLVTGFYVLPVSNSLVAETETACKCVDKDADENTKKEKESQKEFLTVATPLFTFYTANMPVAALHTKAVLPVHTVVETPPPDKA